MPVTLKSTATTTSAPSASWTCASRTPSESVSTRMIVVSATASRAATVNCSASMPLSGVSPVPGPCGADWLESAATGAGWSSAEARLTAPGVGAAAPAAAPMMVRVFLLTWFLLIGSIGGVRPCGAWVEDRFESGKGSVRSPGIDR